MSYRIGVDVGGTFTDCVLAQPGSGRLFSFKEPSTPHDPSLAVERGVAELLTRHRVAPAEIDTVVHGTTLGLNAILQRRGADAMPVVSTGNRDVLELARCRMPSPYDFSLPRDEPLLARDRVLEIGARCDARGRVMMRPDAAELDRVAARIREHTAEAVALTVLNAYLNPAFEDEVARALEARLGGVHVTPSTRVWPELREYERSMLAVMNAYVHPMLDAYYARLEERLQGLDIEAALYITASNGGTLSVASARERPVDTLLSGPASGVVAACRLASALGRSRMVSIDMGGTSCDMAVSEGTHPRLTTRAHLGEFPVIAPVVDVSAIGAGGGSVVWADSQGVLKVGPGSAGADPGPVCYGRGGTDPTITDCFLVTGLVDADTFLGGRMRLDREAAADALAALGAHVGFAGDDAAMRTADAAIRVATAMMSTALYKELAQRGVDPRGLDLVAFGGAGPTQAALLAEEARLGRIVIPLSPGTFCALGAIQSDVRREFVRTLRTSLASDPTSAASVRDGLADMEREALDWVASQGHGLSEPTIERSADMRYAGQAYDLRIGLDDDRRGDAADAADAGDAGDRGDGGDGDDAAALAARFHCEHTRLYGFPDPDSEVEVVTVRLSVTRSMAPIHPPPVDASDEAPVAVGERELTLRGERHIAAVYRRDELRAGQILDGPAIIEQEDTTVLVGPHWSARVHRDATLVLTHDTPPGGPR